MTPFIKQICDYLAANSDGALQFGDGNKNLKIGELIRGQEGVFALSVPSLAPDMETPVETHQIDFWASNTETPLAREHLELIYNLFHQNHHYNLNSYHVYFSYASGQIEDLDRDGEGRKLLRLGIVFIIISLIS